MIYLSWNPLHPDRFRCNGIVTFVERLKACKTLTYLRWRVTVMPSHKKTGFMEHPEHNLFRCNAIVNNLESDYWEREVGSTYHGVITYIAILRGFEKIMSGSSGT